MKIVLDTNVFVSGVFWSGPPFRILQAWKERRVELALSPAIFDEYERVANELACSHPEVDLLPWLDLLVATASFVEDRLLDEPVCSDPDDDKFIACALEASARCIVTGDKALLRVNGYRGVEVLGPIVFVRKHLELRRRNR
ncbi:MAG: putative toxin-antitoxin system toxin component, PIN family [Planctomycetes bacterium]|nr:putative toxin-antitoxin system toxin component, PIN family [Planctomycetota bacterium]